MTTNTIKIVVSGPSGIGKSGLTFALTKFLLDSGLNAQLSCTTDNIDEARSNKVLESLKTRKTIVSVSCRDKKL